MIDKKDEKIIEQIQGKAHARLVPGSSWEETEAITIHNGPKVKTKTKDKKAKAILEKAIVGCTEFSLQIAESPNEVVVVAFVAHMTKEEAEKLYG